MHTHTALNQNMLRSVRTIDQPARASSQLLASRVIEITNQLMLDQDERGLLGASPSARRAATAVAVVKVVCKPLDRLCSWHARRKAAAVSERRAARAVLRLRGWDHALDPVLALSRQTLRNVALELRAPTPTAPHSPVTTEPGHTRCSLKGQDTSLYTTPKAQHRRTMRAFLVVSLYAVAVMASPSMPSLTSAWRTVRAGVSLCSMHAHSIVQHKASSNGAVLCRPMARTTQ
jgi:hypothetical protein